MKMIGPYDYDISTLDKEITHTKSGSYALGYVDLNKFIIEYVGRSDSDVRGALMKHMSSSKYEMFKFSYAISREVGNLI